MSSNLSPDLWTGIVGRLDCGSYCLTISGPTQVRIDVRDNGHGAAASNGHGHGLIGIRERVKLYGGEMSTGTVNGSGFTLSARLPLTKYRS